MRDVFVDLRLFLIEADPRPAAVRANLVQARVQAALDSPALVVGEVEMQPVELEGREGVDECQQLALGREVACDVDVRAAPGQGRLVVDLRARELPVDAYPAAERRARLHLVVQPGGWSARRRQRQPGLRLG